MTAQVVTDCSLAMAWCFQDEATPQTDHVLESFAQGAECLVPSHWTLEVANTLLGAIRAKRISHDRVTQFVTLLDTLPITIDSETAAHGLGRILALSQETGLTSYDAAYLELAIRKGVPLASLDNALRSAATARGIPVLGR